MSQQQNKQDKQSVEGLTKAPRQSQEGNCLGLSCSEPRAENIMSAQKPNVKGEDKTGSIPQGGQGVLNKQGNEYEPPSGVHLSQKQPLDLAGKADKQSLGDQFQQGYTQHQGWSGSTLQQGSGLGSQQQETGLGGHFQQGYGTGSGKQTATALD
jgi:hypothetical protein